MLDSTTQGLASNILVIGVAELLGGRDVLENKEAVRGVFEGRLGIMQQGLELP